MSNALQTQVDGNHYKVLKIQPLELAYLIGASPCFTKAAKYLTRDKGDQKINIDKALHVIAIEHEISRKSYQAIKDHYPAVESPLISAQALLLINIFTENEDIRAALYSMYMRNYSAATEAVKQYRSKLDV